MTDEPVGVFLWLEEIAFSGRDATLTFGGRLLPDEVQPLFLALVGVARPWMVAQRGETRIEGSAVVGGQVGFERRGVLTDEGRKLLAALGEGSGFLAALGALPDEWFTDSPVIDGYDVTARLETRSPLPAGVERGQRFLLTFRREETAAPPSVMSLGVDGNPRLSDLIHALTAVKSAHGDGPVVTRDGREGWERSLISVSRTDNGCYLLDSGHYGFSFRDSAGKPRFPAREVFRFLDEEDE